MYQFIETIRLQNGNVAHLGWHQKRLDEIFIEFYAKQKSWTLHHIISSIDLPSSGLFKVRFLYNDESYKIEVNSYKRRIISNFELITTQESYPYKSTDRTFLHIAVERSEADEVIFCKNYKITDSSYANIALYNGEKWMTPNTFLLNGTTRQRLLHEGKIHEETIQCNQLNRYQKLSFINAMNDLGEMVIDLDVL